MYITTRDQKMKNLNGKGYLAQFMRWNHALYEQGINREFEQRLLRVEHILRCTRVNLVCEASSGTTTGT